MININLQKKNFTNYTCKNLSVSAKNVNIFNTDLTNGVPTRNRIYILFIFIPIL